MEYTLVFEQFLVNPTYMIKVTKVGILDDDPIRHFDYYLDYSLSYP